jgi:cytochrome oxidase Cu insertion factor (SCO1/SenC/PrrC family)
MDRDEKRGAGQIKVLHRSRSTSRKIAIAVGWALVGSVAVVTGAPNVSWSQHSHVAQTSAPTIGAPAIGFELKSHDGKSLSLESLRGKPVI